MNKGRNDGLKAEEKIDCLFDSGQIGVDSLTYIRGRSLPQRYIIIDDAQNLTPHEIKTITSRAGNGTNIVLTGDPYQIDNPYYMHYSDIDLFKSIVDCGLVGIEAWRIKHSESTVKKFIDMSKEFNIIATGGSDCHGPFKKEKPIMGKIKVPYSVLVNLKNARESLYKN
jgi:hypothetical protein